MDTWEPSDTWCRIFMKEQLNFTYRRATTEKTADDITEKQKILWDQLLERLALDLAEGVIPSLMIGSDEFGINFFPVCKYTYALKGAKEVSIKHLQNKAQYTGNIAHSAKGDLVTFQVVYDGKTSNSLPDLSLRNTVPNWTFGFSSNHWSNLQEKKRLIQKFWSYRLELLDKLVKDGLISATASSNAPMVVLLDCWSVNTSMDFKEWILSEYKGLIRIRYIPAGLTGKCQINDTYFHAPYKHWVVKEAENWYSELYLRLLNRFESKEISEEDFKNLLTKAMGKKI